MSNSFTRKDYLSLIQKFAEEQYDTPDEEEPKLEDYWMPAESPLKKKIQEPTNAGAADVTKVKKDQVMDCLKKFRNIKVGNFLIKITKYHNDESGDFTKGMVDLYIYEEKNKTASGQPAKMHNKINLSKDDRFENRPWLSHSNKYNPEFLSKVPMLTVVEIVRWLQGITRLTAFL
jgi:hypothetical protein